MNKIIFRILALAMIVTVAACSGKTEKAEAQAVNSEDWPEMDQFHMIMAESFHPYKDSANLSPAIANAAEMASFAAKWAEAPLPEKVNNDNVKGNLQQLKITTASFSELVAAGDAKAIGEALTGLHDDFHKLQEAWYSRESKDEAHDHHEH